MRSDAQQVCCGAKFTHVSTAQRKSARMSACVDASGLFSLAIQVRVQSLWAIANLAVHKDTKIHMATLAVLEALQFALNTCEDEATTMQAGRALMGGARADGNGMPK